MDSLADSLPKQRFNRAFFTLLGLLFLAAPLYYQDNLGSEGLFLPFNNTVWIAASFLIALGLLKFSYSRVLLLPKMTAAILFCLGMTTLVGVIGNVSAPTSWLFRNLSLWGGMLLLFSCAQFELSRRQRDNLLYLLLGSTYIQALYCLIHLLALSSPPDWMSQSLGVPRGIFQQQNVAASYLATGLLIGLFLTTLPSYRQRHWLVKFFVLSSMTLNSLIIITSGSRAGLLAAVLGVLLMLGLRHRQLIKNGGRAFSLLLLALVIGTGLGYQMGSQTGGIQAGLKKFSQAPQTSTDPARDDVRIMIYASSWELFLEKPILGHGFGQFESVWHAKKAQYLADHPDAGILITRLTHPHNELLYWAVEGGLVALSGILVLGLAFLKVCANLGWQRGGAYLVLLLPITLHTQVELPFYISQLHWLLFIVLIALVASHRFKRRTVPLSQMIRTLMLALSISLPVLATIFFVHSLISNRILLSYLVHPTTDIRVLDYPSHNIYYTEKTNAMRLQTLVQYGLMTKNIKILKDYIPLAETTLQQTPDINLLVGLTFALYRTGEYQRSYAMLRRGLSIYPSAPLMLTAKQALQRHDKDAGLPVGVP
ncbi:MAG: O-antigen polymerase [Motiliproteus sp.]|jgi:O-antigen polymerase